MSESPPQHWAVNGKEEEEEEEGEEEEGQNQVEPNAHTQCQERVAQSSLRRVTGPAHIATAIATVDLQMKKYTWQLPWALVYKW